MFAQTLAALGRWLGLGPGTGKEDRRSWGRVPIHLRTTCRVVASDHAEEIFNVQVMNVSPGGICLYLSQSFPPGTLLGVALPEATNPDEAESASVLACVVRCAPKRTGGWEVGCTFASPLSDEELRRFTARTPRIPAPELRNHPRHDLDAAAVYRVVKGAALSDPAPASVLNVSGGGVALRVDGVLNVGELLSVELSRGRQPTLTALATVVRSSVSHDGACIVGCNFIRELSEQQIHQLLH